MMPPVLLALISLAVLIIAGWLMEIAVCGPGADTGARVSVGLLSGVLCVMGIFMALTAAREMKQ